MALADTQKAQIRRWLGYPDPLVTTLIRYPLEGNMDELSPAGEVQVEAILEGLSAIEAQVASVRTRAGLKRVEDIEFYGSGDAHQALGLDANDLVDQLAAILDAPVLHHPTNAGRFGGGVARRGA